MKLELVQRNVNSDDKGRWGYNNVDLFIDSETGVEYFVIDKPDGVAMCPRLNVDGKPFIGKKGI